MIEYGKEIRVGEHRVYVSDDNIIHVASIGEIDDETANAIFEISREMMTTQKENLKVAIDCNKTGKPSPKARGVFQELGRNERVAKVAAFGLPSRRSSGLREKGPNWRPKKRLKIGSTQKPTQKVAQ